MEDRSSFVMLSMVAIVAILALVVLVSRPSIPNQLGQSFVPTQSDQDIFIEEQSDSGIQSDDLAGMAGARVTNAKLKINCGETKEGNLRVEFNFPDRGDDTTSSDVTICKRHAQSEGEIAVEAYVKTLECNPNKCKKGEGCASPPTLVDKGKTIDVKFKDMAGGVPDICITTMKHVKIRCNACAVCSTTTATSDKTYQCNTATVSLTTVKDLASINTAYHADGSGATIGSAQGSGATIDSAGSTPDYGRYTGGMS